jgi:DNA-binding XRE family transcriptional regulator
MASTDKRYPNKLRHAREAAFLSRKRLAALCAQLADADPVRYTAVGESTINHLERGKAQPRASTAATLAKALGGAVADLFPGGVDIKSRK